MAMNEPSEPTEMFGILGERPGARRIIEEMGRDPSREIFMKGAEKILRGQRALAEEAVGDVLEYIHSRPIDGRLMVLLDDPSPEAQRSLKSTMYALAWRRLRGRCLDILQQTARRRTSELQGGAPRPSPLPAAVDLVALASKLGLDVDLKPGADPAAQRARIVGALARVADLDRRETQFLLFKVERPEAPEHDFDRSMSPTAIHHFKCRVLDKLEAALEIPSRSPRKRRD